MSSRGHRGESWKRIAWFVGLWAAGVLAVSAIGYLIRAAIPG